MKIKLLIFLFSINVFLLLSCSDDDEDCTYAPINCITESLDSGYVKISLSYVEGDNPVKVELYSGNVESGTLLWEKELSTDFYSFKTANGNLSARAKYTTTIDGQVVTVYSVDGDHLYSSSESYCDADCYEEGIIKLNIKLNEDIIE